MNEFTHFFTGYLLARALRYKHSRFETFFLAFASLIPDMDFTVSMFFPIEHGVFTHTLIGGILFAMVVVLVTWVIKIAINSRNPGMIAIRFTTLIGLALLGVATHLAVDSFTFYESVADATHHLYFWPLWDFPVHINTLFPGTTYDTRVLVEVVYSVVLGAIILFYQWAYRKENPFLSFSPWAWKDLLASQGQVRSHPVKIKIAIIFISFAVLGAGYIWLDIVLAMVLLEGFLGIVYFFDLKTRKIRQA